MVFLDVKKNTNYARYVPSIECEPELFIKFDKPDELAELMRDKMNKATIQTKKLIHELYKTEKRNQLEAEKYNAT